MDRWIWSWKSFSLGILAKISTDSYMCKITWITHHPPLVFGRFISFDLNTVKHKKNIDVYS